MTPPFSLQSWKLLAHSVPAVRSSKHGISKKFILGTNLIIICKLSFNDIRINMMIKKNFDLNKF